VFSTVSNKRLRSWKASLIFACWYACFLSNHLQIHVAVYLPVGCGVELNSLAKLPISIVGKKKTKRAALCGWLNNPCYRRHHGWDGNRTLNHTHTHQPSVGERQYFFIPKTSLLNKLEPYVFSGLILQKLSRVVFTWQNTWVKVGFSLGTAEWKLSSNAPHFCIL